MSNFISFSKKRFCVYLAFCCGLSLELKAEFDESGIVYIENSHANRINYAYPDYREENQHFLNNFTQHDINNATIINSKFSGTIVYLGNTNRIENTLFEKNVKEKKSSIKH